MAGGKYSKIVSSWRNFDKTLKETSNLRGNFVSEKEYSAELNKRGVKSYFEEKFGIPDSRTGQLVRVPLEEQELPVVGPFEDIRLTTSFQNGRERGKFLAEHGYTEEMYLTIFIPDFEKNYDKSKHR